MDALIEFKRRRAAEDPELFAAYWALVADAQSVVDPSWKAMVPPAVAQIIKTKGLFRTKSVLGAPLQDENLWPFNGGE